MSLQRGENVRGWSDVTKDMATANDGRTGWRIGMIGLVVVWVVVAMAAYRLYQADFSNLARVPLLVALLIFLLALLIRIFSTLGAQPPVTAPIRSSATRAAPHDTAATAARRAEEERQRAEAEAQAAAARAAEEEAAAARAANLERERAAAEERAAAAAAKATEEAADAARQEAEADAAAAKAASAGAASGPDRDGDGVVEGENEGTRPAALDGPRGGVPDDLKLIKGVGPKLEAVCNSLGFWHFDQISNWTADEIAWVDSNLEGFKGRVTRDDWVAQAKILASGGTTEFAERQKED